MITSAILYLLFGSYLIFKIYTEGNGPVYTRGGIWTYSELAWFWWLFPVAVVLFIWANEADKRRRARFSRMPPRSEADQQEKHRLDSARIEKRLAVIKRYPWYRRWWHLGMGTVYNDEPHHPSPSLSLEGRGISYASLPSAR